MARGGLAILGVAALVAGMVGACRGVGGESADRRGEKGPVIVCGAGEEPLVRLAAKEIRRYVYLRTGALLEIEARVPAEGRAIVVGRAEERDQGPEAWRIETRDKGDCRVTRVGGGGAVGTLYAAYRFAEKLGVRFYPHGDVIPDGTVALDLDAVDDAGAPLFALRGLHPFHDFPEGPDWWNLAEYEALLAQLPKLGMNFFALHTYPEGPVGPEPTVWIGPSNELTAEGAVAASYPSRHFTTHTGGWGYAARDTGDFLFGAAELFPADDFGADVMGGRSPLPRSAADCNRLFEDFGAILHDAFGFARRLGIKTCLGTETPLTLPASVRNRLVAAGRDPADPAVVKDVYTAMFRRIAATHSLDYFWLWTPEGWTWGGASREQVDATLADIALAHDALEASGAPFTLATCGWVLGPPGDRARFDRELPADMPLSCISRNVGFAPVEPGFARIEGRPTWSIPWLEDDPGLILPQLWAGRMRRDAADSLAYGCTGLMGIHWRTRVLGPNAAALARAAWEQEEWNPEFGTPFTPAPDETLDGAQGGKVAAFPDREIADTDEDEIYRTVRWGLDAWRLALPAGSYRVRLMFCEPHYGEAGKRRFGVRLQGKVVIEGLDVFARVGKDRALDFVFEDVDVGDAGLRIEFTPEVEFPCIAGIEVEGEHGTRRVNCAGAAWGGYEADPGCSPYAAGLRGRPRDLPVDDFYADWARAAFGDGAAAELAGLFTRLDGTPDGVRDGSQAAKLPRPATWIGGPGGVRPDPRPWEEVAADYAFVDEMEALRPRIRGAGNRERFDWWLDTFRTLRATGRMCCTWARFEAAMEEVRAEEDPAAKARIARARALPVRIELVARLAELHRHLLATVTTPGALGTVANWQQHLLPGILTAPGAELALALGEELPAEAVPSAAYTGPPRIFLSGASTLVDGGAVLLPTLRVVIQGATPARAVLRWRPLGAGAFTERPLTHVARGVWEASLPPAAHFRDLEYHVLVVTEEGEELRWPATAPARNHTLVVLDAG